MAGITAGGVAASDVADLRERDGGAAGRAERRRGAGRHGRGADIPRVIVLMCHEERVEVFELLDRLGARPVDVPTELTTLVPRLQERPRRG